MISTYVAFTSVTGQAVPQTAYLRQAEGVKSNSSVKHLSVFDLAAGVDEQTADSRCLAAWAS